MIWSDFGHFRMSGSIICRQLLLSLTSSFGLCGSIYILHPAIWGSHPEPCLSTQIAERQGTAMYYTSAYLVLTHSLKIYVNIMV